MGRWEPLYLGKPSGQGTHRVPGALGGSQTLRKTSEASYQGPRVGQDQGRGGQEPVLFAYISGAGAPHPGAGRLKPGALHVHALAAPPAKCPTPAGREVCLLSCLCGGGVFGAP